jgi:hypothetical protein
MSLLLASGASPYWFLQKNINHGVMAMYPRNAVSPQRLSIGPVVQIANGAVQTSGVSVDIVPQGGAASSGVGTIAYEQGIVHYIPTQAETNYTSFMLIAYKTGCIPASTTVVTSVSGTSGYAGLDWSYILSPTTTVNLSNTTVGTASAVTGLTASNLDVAVSTLGTAAALATVDSVVDAIKLKTDSLTFTKAGEIDANIQSINDVTITGNGSTGTEFGV